MIPLAQLVGCHIVMGGFEQKLLGLQVRRKGVVAEDGFAETMGIVFGCLVKDGKDRQIVLCVGEKVQIIAEIPGITG